MRNDDPRNNHAYRRLRKRIYATYRTCWLCGTTVDQTLPPNHRMARTLDHVTPLNKGGDLLDPANARLAHRTCNSARQDNEPPPLPTHHHTEW